MIVQFTEIQWFISSTCVTHHPRRLHTPYITHRNVRGDIVSYSGRDLTFEKKWDQWIKDGKPEGKKPNKHRYVAGYHRGIELFGAMVSRLEEPQLQKSLKQNGLVVVEGMNDVIRLDELGICAVGLCSNRATETQIDAIVRFAKHVANNRVLLFPDNDPEGEAGFKELLWGLNKLGSFVELARLENPVIGQPEDVVDWKAIELRNRN